MKSKAGVVYTQKYTEDFMELLLISDKKLKIMLTKQDMEKYNLKAEGLDYSIKNTRQILDEIFEIAGRKTGFEAKKGRIFVQAYPSVDGGCEIYLTRLENEISGLVEDGSTDTYIISIYTSQKEAAESGEKIRSNPNVNGIDIYKDRYKNTYLVTVKLHKNVSQENQTYISAYFSEIGAKKSGVFKRQSFSRERYKLIKSI